MESLRELFRIGTGPSASHTMGPRRASETFRSRNPQAASFKVTLYGALAATGKGHLTDAAIKEVFSRSNVEIIWKADTVLPSHPNGMLFEAIGKDHSVIDSWTVFSVGGGSLKEDGQSSDAINIYPFNQMKDIMNWAEDSGKTIWQLVEECEGSTIWHYIQEVWQAMQAAVRRGISAEGALPGSLKLARKASSYYSKSKLFNPQLKRSALLSAYALAVSEENAAGGTVVTAPTCGSCGVLPSVLMYVKETYAASDKEILRAIATAAVVGNVVKTNGSISGAEVGCQGEIGTACAMASAAAAQLMGATPRQVEYAAEMGIEHHLGLTCDPVAGLVQIPCIERNAFAAMRALDCAEYALLSDGVHRISFDDVVETMKQTGVDLQICYRETSTGGLAVHYHANSVQNK